MSLRRRSAYAFAVKLPQIEPFINAMMGAESHPAAKRLAGATHQDGRIKISNRWTVGRLSYGARGFLTTFFVRVDDLSPVQRQSLLNVGMPLAEIVNEDARWS